jgi:AcrR family transcriptional regulator
LLGSTFVTVTERPRARALSASERRAAIVAATLPLLLERGIGVTTKQIADAAGIAEGTIFRVFPDKNALLGAVLDAAGDTSVAEAAIGAIDDSLSIDRQVEEAVRVIQRRVLEVWRVVSAVLDTDAFRGRRRRKAADIASLTVWFERHRDVIRGDPGLAARALQGLTIGVSHPAFYGDEPMDPADIARLFLDGLRAAKGVSC